MVVLLPAEPRLSLPRGAGHHADRHDRQLLRRRAAVLAARPGAASSAASCREREISRNPAMLYVAIGILGATVMPHNLYLHSSIVQTRKYRAATTRGKRRGDQVCHDRFDVRADVRALHQRRHPRSSRRRPSTRRASATSRRSRMPTTCSTPLLGVAWRAPSSRVALLASGQNSTLTGTLAGQIVMEGFLNIRLRPWLRRLMTRGHRHRPGGGRHRHLRRGKTTELLVASQVVLSMQLGFAGWPLMRFTGDRAKMGRFVNPSTHQGARLHDGGDHHRIEPQAAVRHIHPRIMARRHLRRVTESRHVSTHLGRP